MEIHRSAEIHSRPVEEIQARVDGYLGGGCELMGSLAPGRVMQNRGRGAHTGAGFPCGGPRLAQAMPEGLQPVED